jgi:hypothetical protein
MSGNCTGNGTKVSGVTSPDVITSLTNGTIYYYMMTCVNAAGESACSSEVSGTPNVTVSVPGAPTSVAATAGNAQNTITWSAPSSGGTATSYNLYWKSGSSMSGNCTGNGTKVSGVTSPDVITSLTNGTTYYYMLTAVNATGEGACSNEASATPAASAVNYTAFTNVGSGFTVASSTLITFSSIPNQISDYLYNDFGANYFGTNFTHYIDVNISSQSGTLAVLGLWELSNTVGDMTNNKVTGDLNSSVGTYGTLYAYIYDTSAHRLAGGSTGLLSTLSLTLHTSTTWRYLYGASSWNGSYSGTTSGSVQNLTIIH